MAYRMQNGLKKACINLKNGGYTFLPIPGKRITSQVLRDFFKRTNRTAITNGEN